MELVYLWVEDYKNIKKQEFNFSPNYECEFIPDYEKYIDNDGKEGEKVTDKSKLKITPKENHLKDFFGKDINITAIIGENGSGKSSLVNILLDSFSPEYWDVEKTKFILIYKYNNQIREFSNFKFKKENTVISQIENLLQIQGEYPSSEHIDLLVLNINNEYEKLKERRSPQFFNENSKLSFREVSLLIIDNTIISSYNQDFFNPKEVIIGIKELDYFNDILDDDIDFYDDEVWQEITNLKKELDGKSFIKRLELVSKIFEIKRNKHKNVSKLSLSRRITESYFVFKYRFEKSLLENIPEIIKKDNSSNKFLTLDIDKFNKEMLNYIEKLPYIFDILLKDNYKLFSDLSFGERQILILLHSILKYMTKKEYSVYIHDEEGNEIEKNYTINKLVVFIDEFELGLHPNWQKRFIKELYEFFNLIGRDIHFIITSHSPFLLSDIPKQNVIFLKKDEEIGNCINVTNDIWLNPFGANIHTLLSHGFFMKDGLMGEFAKNKITKILNFLSNKSKWIDTPIDNIKPIIKLIGEPFLKDKLLKMYDVKFPKLNDEKEIRKQLLENEIKKLQKELKGL